MRPTSVQDFLDRIEPEPNSGCWIWLGTRITRYGYINVTGRLRLAHRISFLFHGGAIPAGYELDHTCRNRYCVNPAHLEAVTHRTNVLRGVSPLAEHARRQVCHRGHPLLTQFHTAGVRRRCQTCQRVTNLAYRQRVLTKPKLIKEAAR